MYPRGTKYHPKAILCPPNHFKVNLEIPLRTYFVFWMVSKRSLGFKKKIHLIGGGEVAST